MHGMKIKIKYFVCFYGRQFSFYGRQFSFRAESIYILVLVN